MRRNRMLLFTDHNRNDIAPFCRPWCTEAGLTDA